MGIDHILQQKITDYEGLTFDDILLLPNYTDFKRREVDLTTQLHPKIILRLPVIAAPMDTVCEEKMAIALAANGGLGVIHRNLAIKTQQAMVNEVKKTKPKDEKKAALDDKKRLLAAAGLGVGSDCQERIRALVASEIDLLVIDSGHGHSKFVVDTVLYIKKTYPFLPVMAGNVASYEGAKTLIEAGCDILRVGMGPGSICTTRVVTGMGVPQVTAILETVRACQDRSVAVVADGGIRQIGDIAKAIAAGATAAMLGSLLARFDESPGQTVVLDGKTYKQYRGMGSAAAMKQGSAERYGQSKTTTGRSLIAEGVEGYVEHKGKVSHYLDQIEGSLKSSFYYVGAKTVREFFGKSHFIKISRSGVLENHPHSVIIKNPGDNYTV